MGDGFLSFGGIDVPEDRDLTDIDHVILLENDDSLEEEYPNTRRHSFIFDTNGLKASAAFRNKADFDVQFDILAQASATIVDILGGGAKVRVLCRHGRNRSVSVVLNVCRLLGMDVADMLSKMSGDYADSRKKLLKDELLQEVSLLLSQGGGVFSKFILDTKAPPPLRTKK